MKEKLRLLRKALAMGLTLEASYHKGDENMLGTLQSEKVIPRSYGNIRHLPGSKMIDDQDKLLPQVNSDWLTKEARGKNDLIVVTEKVDGMNCSVYRKGYKLYPLLRKGYDARTSHWSWIRDFAKYVEYYSDTFFELLGDGQRVCGDWLYKTHTLRYNMKSTPFVAFDLIDAENKRTRYFDFSLLMDTYEIPKVSLIHAGKPLPTNLALTLLGKGYHGSIDGPEGVVYRYESEKNGFEFSGKFVSNERLGNDEFFLANDDTTFNKFRQKDLSFLVAKGV
jgi:hypothetical protein